ncbi:DUF4924 family protein [Sunxiuqinia elliptica]|uniref:Uncharacterized protein DUF4924 n=1 Tax=Sunxiuqinia elliptica TaxID=655355 RepID=A0A4R6HB06_9BACT|nr:DUF4924 family protein [Sunxiuqinia elliptica]TDO05344.1 uncharacterized protein DUF4924 [Sunxiuqinia elliptica]TDO64893.1 uncharacterized protein DUF4924 [Sunxiuqinia elliptica]
MLIAKEKRKKNIAEYILYLWQVEDLLRALKFDPEQIDRNLVARFEVDKDTRKEIADWYQNLALMMEKERITQQGHLQFVLNLIDDLYQFHLQLLGTRKDPQYPALFQLAKPVLEEFKTKSATQEDNDIRFAFQALYSIMLLRLQKKEISTSTQTAMEHISKLIAHLSARYLQFEQGKFDL